VPFDPVELLAAHPATLVLIVFGAALLEYVFPPFWGDTLMLAGCFMAGTHRASAAGVFAAALLGSCAGAACAYGLGRRFGRASFSLLAWSSRAQRLRERAERLYDDHGSRVLAVNRFLPGARAFFLPLAGVGNMPFGRVLVWSSVSNVAWCGLLLGAGLWVGATAPSFAAMQGSFRTLTLVGAAAAAGLLLLLTARHLLGRTRA
jgi:membrane-associated protein